MLTIIELPTTRMSNDRVPLDGAPRCQTQWTLCLDENGVVSVFARDYFGSDSTPMDEYDQRTLTWGIGCRGDGSVINRDTLSQYLAEGGILRGLLERVHAGHSVDWNGQNHVGRLNDDAIAACDDIDTVLRNDDYTDYTDDDAPVILDAYEWITARGSSSPANCLLDLELTTQATPEQIAAAVTAVEESAARDDAELVGTRDAIEALIKEVAETEAEAEEEA